MFWIEMNSHWSVSFQISFTINYFIFKHHVKNSRHLSCIEFNRCFDVNHSNVRNKAIECRSIKCNCYHIKFICIQCRIRHIEHNYAKFHLEKSSDRNRVVNIHQQSFSFLLQETHSKSRFLINNHRKFRKFRH